MRNIAFFFVVVVSMAVAVVVLAVDIPVGERSLTSQGVAYGIARDASGNMVITDWSMGEVWRVNPVTGAYSLYRGLGNTLDARADGAGNIWLTSFWYPRLNRINTSASPVSMTTWDLTAWDTGRTYKLSGLAFDDLNRVWFSEWGETSDTQLLYRFDPGTNQLCGYTLPGGNHSWYLLYQAPYLWLGDWVQGTILQFNTTNRAVTYWGAGTKAEPRGLSLDASGNIWWADVNTGKIGRLVPGTNGLTLFTLPDAGAPNLARPYMVMVDAGKIWYTAQGDEVGTVGMLDPGLASGSTTTAKRSTFTAAETCKQLAVPTTANISTTSGTWTEPWTTRVWTEVSPAGVPGWRVFEAPGAELPYGLSIGNSNLWFTDQMYNKLLKISLPIPMPTPTPVTPTNTPTRTPTNTPTRTATTAPTRTATNTPTRTATNTPTTKATTVPTKTATNTPTRTATNAPSTTPSTVPTKTATAIPSNTPSSQPTPTPTNPSTSNPTASATPTAISIPTATTTNAEPNRPMGYRIYLPLIMVGSPH